MVIVGPKCFAHSAGSLYVYIYICVCVFTYIDVYGIYTHTIVFGNLDFQGSIAAAAEAEAKCKISPGLARLVKLARLAVKGENSEARRSG